MAAKYMYRSVANFNIWALTAVQKGAAGRPVTSRKPGHPSDSESGSLTTPGESNFRKSRVDVEGQRIASDEDAQSEWSDDSESSASTKNAQDKKVLSRIGNADDRITVSGSLPSFGQGNIIRERVSTRGFTRSMEPEEQMGALTMSPEHIGRVHMAGPISKWLSTRNDFERRYPKDLAKFRKIKADDYEKACQYGFLTRNLQGENPPQCALASWHDVDLARQAGRSVDEPMTKSSTAMLLYMKISQKPDEHQVGDYTDISHLAVEQEKAKQADSGEHDDLPQ